MIALVVGLIIALFQALTSIQEMTLTFVPKIVGENARDSDLGVNIVKGKAFSNVRESNKEATVVLKASRVISLESGLEYIQDDELVEITPDAIRLRKRILDEGKRKQIARHQKAAAAGN